MTQRAYLDWNGSGLLRPEAAEAMAEALNLPGNPSSVHQEGRRARQIVEAARQAVADLVGAKASWVSFTSGGTEANMMALSPAIAYGRDRQSPDRLLVSALEHPSVLCGGQFGTEAIEIIPAGVDGRVSLQALAARLTELRKFGATPLVSLMLANNETGIVQPVNEAADLVHEAGGLLHVDAVQGPGRMPCSLNALRADLMTLSAHKIGGPKGVGALICRNEAVHLRRPLIRGGGQEFGRRAGTENVAGITGFGAAARAVTQNGADEASHARDLRDLLETGLRRACADLVIFGDGVERLPNTTLFAVPGMSAETALIRFDLEGCAVSSGAACSSGKVKLSHVLAAMGVEPTTAKGAIRVSLGYSTTQSDVELCLGAFEKGLDALDRGRGIAA